MGRRQSSEISAGSMADIAFLLLIFFLVTSEMTKEEGMMQILPEKADQEVTEPVKERNAIRIFMNDKNQILFEDQTGLEMSDIPSLLKEQILNVSDDPNMPENRLITEEELQVIIDRNRENLAKSPPEKYRAFTKRLNKSELRLEAFKTFGNSFKKSSHVISVTSDQGVKYGPYIALKDMIKKSYRELRSDLAQKKLGRPWEDLTYKEKKMLEMVYNENVSESPIERK